MLNVYFHCNESCIDPMLLSIPPPSSSPTTASAQTTPIVTTTTPTTTKARTIAKTENSADRPAIRHSIVSQYSSTTASGSTRRDSFGSSDVDQDLQTRRWSAESFGSLEHVLSRPTSPTAGSFSSLQPSSRFLLSGATSAETFRQQELSRFYPPSSSTKTTSTIASGTSRRIKALSDSFVNMPSIALATQPMASAHTFYDNKTPSSTSSTNTTDSNAQDPWCMSVKMAQDAALCENWISKYESPTFAFARSWKRRYIVLTDRIVYVFKSKKPTTPAREHFLLTDDTLIFVTEDFKKGCVIEIRKPLCKWYLRCESITQMKHWLEAMKKVVACLKLGYSGALTTSLLSSLTLTDDARLLTSSTKKSSTTDPQQQQHIHHQHHHHHHHHRQSLQPQNILYKQQPLHHHHLLSRNYHLQQPPFGEAPPPRSKRSSTPVISFSNSPPSSSSKRQSLAQIPHWEKTLPPLMPPPTSLPPPPPTPTSSLSSSLPRSNPTSSSSANQHPRPSSAIYPSHSSTAAATTAVASSLPAVSEMQMDPIDPAMMSHSLPYSLSS
ncbi:hypothetical protein BCR42DRAFT_491374 [Absidia repens]|uniref:PH domain-containing protein n=1 Tax=Absidia repens TaxID=90262 RepID=A0A1X2IGP2_9FUNG|nr:hypothetical protein BCR42DRAFT_491374 [Absidia repens]